MQIQTLGANYNILQNIITVTLRVDHHHHISTAYLFSKQALAWLSQAKTTLDQRRISNFFKSEKVHVNIGLLFYVELVYVDFLCSLRVPGLAYMAFRTSKISQVLHTSVGCLEMCDQWIQDFDHLLCIVFFKSYITTMLNYHSIIYIYLGFVLIVDLCFVKVALRSLIKTLFVLTTLCMYLIEFRVVLLL